MSDWKPIDASARDGAYKWVGRAGDFPFADFMRWSAGDQKWFFIDGSWMEEVTPYGTLVYFPLPAAPAEFAA
jgi:hypothetical protein